MLLFFKRFYSRLLRAFIFVYRVHLRVLFIALVRFYGSKKDETKRYFIVLVGVLKDFQKEPQSFGGFKRFYD